MFPLCYGIVGGGARLLMACCEKVNNITQTSAIFPAHRSAPSAESTKANGESKQTKKKERKEGICAHS